MKIFHFRRIKRFIKPKKFVLKLTFMKCKEANFGYLFLFYRFDPNFYILGEVNISMQSNLYLENNSETSLNVFLITKVAQNLGTSLEKAKSIVFFFNIFFSKTTIKRIKRFHWREIQNFVNDSSKMFFFYLKVTGILNWRAHFEKVLDLWDQIFSRAKFFDENVLFPLAFHFRGSIIISP